MDEEGNLVKDDLQFFDQEKLDQLRERQIDTVRFLDDVFEELPGHLVDQRDELRAHIATGRAAYRPT